MKFNKAYLPGSIILVIALVAGVKQIRSQTDAVISSAQIVAINEKHDAVGFKFSLEGVSYFIKEPYDSKKSDYQVGQPVKIIYPATNPKHAEIYTERFPYIFPLAMLVLAFASFGLGYYISSNKLSKQTKKK